MLAAVEDAERLAPDNDHLYNDPTINELCEFAANGRLTLADSLAGGYIHPRPVVVPGARSEDDAVDVNEAHRLHHATGRCDRCFNPLDLMQIEDVNEPHPATSRRLFPVWVNAGRTIVHFNLCRECVDALGAVVKEF